MQLGLSYVTICHSFLDLEHLWHSPYEMKELDSSFR